MKTFKSLFVISFLLLAVACSKDDSLNTSDSTGTNGSLARFVINDNFMYAIDFNYLKTYDISNNDNPVLLNNIKVGYGLETIYLYDNYIYLGANDGVYVISLANPTSPVQLKKIDHDMSCDPVVVQGSYAYSTQRVNAVGCGTSWSVSSLVVYDVTDPTQAEVANTITMQSPFGLAVENNWLYVCDQGKGGIVVFDISDPANPVQVAVASVTEPRDILLLYPYMIVTTKTKFELYNYSDPLNIYQISSVIIS